MFPAAILILIIPVTGVWCETLALAIRTHLQQAMLGDQGDFLSTAGGTPSGRGPDSSVNTYRRDLHMNTTDYSNPKILMLGSESAFSGIVLECLLQAGTEVCGFVTHEAPPPPRAFESLGDKIPVVVAGTGPAIASEGDVPLIYLRSMHDENVLERVRSLEPDFLLVACFPMILSAAWLTVPKQMCLNLHPSVLPSYRGPTPLFWQFREGEHETGVTLHIIEEDVDAGDIVAQGVMPLLVDARFSEV
ncbi:MAG: hypothetical protein E4H28_07510, partial [Gemmatimonadales bacterium]